MSLISTTKLYIGNLTEDTTEEDLKHTFTDYDVVDITVVRDQETEISRGFAFLTFSNEDSCYDALEEMDGTPINGNAITVNEARERRRYVNRGGGGMNNSQKEEVINAISTCINVLQTTLNSLKSGGGGNKRQGRKSYHSKGYGNRRHYDE
jgi:RNA recognition motif-containing protein